MGSDANAGGFASCTVHLDYDLTLDNSVIVHVQSIGNVTYLLIVVIQERSYMAENAATPQQPVISIRISEALRLRLETLRKIISLKSGQTVSTSEAAKQLLESARDDRLELVDLLSEPTDSLLRIRGKADSGLPLSQAEWTVVAHYCAVGAESFMNTAQGQISYESLAEILEAFLAAYAIVTQTEEVPTGLCIPDDSSRGQTGRGQGS